MEKHRHSVLTDSILCCFYSVYNTLGYGFLEKVYQRALCFELESRGISAVAETPITVLYRNQVVGEYFCDVLVENSVILELKATDFLMAKHEAQLLNYLKATPVDVGLLSNFGPDPQVKRKVYSNNRK
ncbi:MAG: GxxExxY protein [Desulfuromusa sp.]|nr:GxxExxY protein [Desulfuromusa sp.]